MNLPRCMNAPLACVKFRKFIFEHLKARFMMNGKSIHDCCLHKNSFKTIDDVKVLITLLTLIDVWLKTNMISRDTPIIDSIKEVC